MLIVLGSSPVLLIAMEKLRKGLEMSCKDCLIYNSLMNQIEDLKDQVEQQRKRIDGLVNKLQEMARNV